MLITIYHGDVLDGLGRLADGSVHCGVTSPPYWGLRDYGVPGQLGLEPTIEEYLAKMVAVFREVRRVLRPDGTLWLNIGDSYNGSGGAGGDYNKGGLKDGQPKYPGRRMHGLKPKDLCMIPARLALALQADGWWLRSDIIWHKPNPMPESCTDRPTTAHEHIFLLTKSARYFYDAEAVKEDCLPESNKRGRYGFPESPRDKLGHSHHGKGYQRNDGSPVAFNGRNLRSVWTMATQAFPGPHYATFPTSLPERCIKAGTSEKGCCPKCQAPWVRVVEKGEAVPRADNPNPVIPYDAKSGCTHGTGATTLHKQRESQTIGWRPGCKCPHTEADVVPATVLDPFGGAMTTAMVAAKLGRNAAAIELNPKDIKLGGDRLRRELGMLAEVTVIPADPNS